MLVFRVFLAKPPHTLQVIHFHLYRAAKTQEPLLHRELGARVNTDERLVAAGC